MTKTYILKDAIIFNPTGKKYNAIASPATLTEIKQQKEYFEFDFASLIKQGAIVYKICKETDPTIIQGLVTFKPSLGVLDCANMEVHNINKRPISIHGNVGKCMVALCCKISFDLGLDGFITFEAKNRLTAYYKRLGAVGTFGLRMAINTQNAKKLVDLYF